MTRDEIDRSLRRIQLTIEAGTPEVAGSFAALFAIVRNQEARLRALEPCPSGRFGMGEPHEWSPIGTCVYCGVRKPRS